MTKGKRREIEAFGMSFLDVISCGFGAIILLLVLSLVLEPKTIRRITVDLRDKISQIEQARELLLGESQKLRRELAEMNEELREKEERVAAMRELLGESQARTTAADTELEAQAQIETTVSELGDLEGKQFDPTDTAILAETIHRLLTDAQLRTRLGRAGQRKVQSQYDASAYARSVEAIYQACHGGSHGHGSGFGV